MYLRSLGSSSKGNSTIIDNGRHSILIDCGFGTNYLEQSLSELNKNLNELNGVIITHIHGDHINSSGLKALLKAGVPIYCSERISSLINSYFPFTKEKSFNKLIKTFNSNSFLLDSFYISPFEVPHDSKGGCFGFRIEFENSMGQKTISIATDLAYAPEKLEENFIDSEIIVIESNHDEKMLEESNRTDELKNRIRTKGHLNNEQSAEFINRILNTSKILPEYILLAHISQECNTNTLAKLIHVRNLKKNNYSEIKVVETFERKPGEIISLKKA